MFRLIVLIALVLAATYLMEAVIRRVRRELGDPGGPATRGPASRGRMRKPVDEAVFGRQSTTVAPGDQLVACAGCGIHTPYSRALWLGKVGPFCSEACRQQAKTAS